MSVDISSIDKQFLWHPFTQMRDWVEDDDLVVIESGRGVYLYDSKGRQFIDGVSSLWCNVHGHCRPEINDAIREQLENIAHSTLLGLASPPAALLAKRLIQLAPPGISRVFYSDSGAAATEIAIKMAFQYWQQCERPRPRKTRFIALPLAYHGDTIGAVSVGGIDPFHRIFRPLLFDVLRAPSPYLPPPPGRLTEQHLQDCIAGLEGILKEHAEEIAAMILEPIVQGAAGMLMAPQGYLRAVRQLCSRYDVLLILDEVATGFGRTGKMFACEHEGVAPDIMAIGKGLSGGYLPLAATLTTEKVYSAFLGDYTESKTFFHGHTFTGNALACAAALASLDIFEKENVLEKMVPRIRQLATWLEERFEPLPHVIETRQRGLMAGIQLARNKSPRLDYGPEERMGRRVCRRARHYSVLIRPLGDVIVIMPPLSISEAELDALMEGIYLATRDVTEGKAG